MSKIKVGDKFGSLTVVSLKTKRSTHGALRWKCKCACGNEVILITSKLTSTGQTNCGCESINHKYRTLKGLRCYSTWQSMKTRCLNPNHEHYHRYGGRGIKISKEFRESVIKFADYLATLPNCPSNWKKPNGTALKPNEIPRTIDRIDNNGDYKRGNIKWSDKKEQGSNYHTTKKFADYTSITDAAHKLGVNRDVVATWLSSGKTKEQMIDSANKLYPPTLSIDPGTKHMAYSIFRNTAKNLNIIAAGMFDSPLHNLTINAKRDTKRRGKSTIKRDDPPFINGAALFLNELLSLIDGYAIRKIVFERFSTRGHGGPTIELIACMLGIITTVCLERGIELVPITPATWKNSAKRVTNNKNILPELYKYAKQNYKMEPHMLDAFLMGIHLNNLDKFQAMLVPSTVDIIYGNKFQSI